MSEFKFACPVCGQHISADSKASGTQLDCPTCFQTIVVPQAPTEGGSKLILSATQVSKSRHFRAGEGELNPLRRRKAVGSIYVIAFCLLVVCVFCTAFLRWRGEILINAFKNDQVTKEATPAYPIPTSTAWTLDLAHAVVPESAAVGRVHGAGFFCERAILRGGLLSLRQGKIWPPDLGISVNLFAQQAEDLSGKTIIVRSDRPPPLPEIVIRWKDEQNQAQTEHIDNGYALKLVFGEAADGKMPGRIFIALPDESRTFVAGTFEAAIRKSLPPKTQPAFNKTGG
jgi:hypothetical protein